MHANQHVESVRVRKSMGVTSKLREPQEDQRLRISVEV